MNLTETAKDIEEERKGNRRDALELMVELIRNDDVAAYADHNADQNAVTAADCGVIAE